MRDGRFELACEDERYDLEPGEGIPAPAGAPRIRRRLSDSAVLNRGISAQAAYTVYVT